MNDDTGRHDHRTLQTGEDVYLIKEPGGNWAIRSYERSWFELGQRTLEGVSLGTLPRQLKTATIQAHDLGWQDLRFDTPEQAYQFVEEQIRSGKAPGAIQPPR